MIFENFFELWSVEGASARQQVQTGRIKRLFLRIDNVICVYLNPIRLPDAFAG
jgi:hypothetical protein